MIVVSAVAIDLSAIKMIADHLESMKTSLSLNHREPRLALSSHRHHRITVNRTAKAAFPVDEADDPLLKTWPFLLIVRTDRIFTAHVSTQSLSCDMNEYRLDTRVFQQIASC